MLHHCAEYLTDFLYRHAAVSLQKRAIYVYGIELTLSTGASFLSIVLFSLLLASPFSSLVFLLVFISLRYFSGGYHAETYRNCFLITNSTYLASFALSKILFLHEAVVFGGILILLSLSGIWRWAPVPNKHHPLSPQAIRKNCWICRFLTLTETALMVLLCVICRNLELFSCFAASITAVAVMMGISKIEERRRK